MPWESDCMQCVFCLSLIIYGLSLRCFPMSDWPDPPVMTAEVTVSTSDSILPRTDIPKSPLALKLFWVILLHHFLCCGFYSTAGFGKEKEQENEKEGERKWNRKHECNHVASVFFVTLFFETSKTLWNLNNFCTPTSIIWLYISIFALKKK